MHQGGANPTRATVARFPSRTAPKSLGIPSHQPLHIRPLPAHQIKPHGQPFRMYVRT